MFSIHFLSASEIEQGLAAQRFCRIPTFDDSSSGRRAYEAHYERQMQLIEDLDDRLTNVYGTNAFVLDNILDAEQLKVEVGENQISRSFLKLVGDFIVENKTKYCVMMVVYTGSLCQPGKNYI